MVGFHKAGRSLTGLTIYHSSLIVRLLDQRELQPTIVGSIPLPVTGIPLRREKRDCPLKIEGLGGFGGKAVVQVREIAGYGRWKVLF